MAICNHLCNKCFVKKLEKFVNQQSTFPPYIVPIEIAHTTLSYSGYLLYYSNKVTGLKVELIVLCTLSNYFFKLMVKLMKNFGKQEKIVLYYNFKVEFYNPSYQY